MSRRAIRSTVLAIGAALAMLALPANAGERGGVAMPDSMQVAGKKLVLNGMGVREATWLNIDVYVAGLYLERVTRNPQEILARDDIKMIHMAFVRDVGRGDVVSAYRDGFKNNAREMLPALQSRIDRFVGWLPGFKDGGVMTLTYVPGRGTHVAINGKSVGSIEGADFGRALFSIWLGPKPPNGGLKKGLLGQ